MEVLKNEEQQAKASSFDPQKTYGWEKGTKVEVDASFLESARAVLTQELSSTESQLTLLKRDIVVTLNSILKDNVESGKFYEVEKPQEEGAVSVEAEEVK